MYIRGSLCIYTRGSLCIHIPGAHCSATSAPSKPRSRETEGQRTMEDRGFAIIQHDMIIQCHIIFHVHRSAMSSNQLS